MHTIYLKMHTVCGDSRVCTGIAAIKREETLAAVRRLEHWANIRRKEIQENARIQIAKLEAESEARIQESKKRVRLAELEADAKRRRQLEDFARKPYRYATCLSLAVWEGRPGDHDAQDDPIEAVFARVLPWCYAHEMGQYNIRRFTLFPDVTLVYIGVQLNHHQVVREFWLSDDDGIKERHKE